MAAIGSPTRQNKISAMPPSVTNAGVPTAVAAASITSAGMNRYVAASGTAVTSRPIAIRNGAAEHARHQREMLHNQRRALDARAQRPPQHDFSQRQQDHRRQRDR